MRGARAKLNEAVTVKLDREALEALDREVQERERDNGAPFSRSLMVRLVVRAWLGLGETPPRTRA